MFQLLARLDNGTHLFERHLVQDAGDIRCQILWVIKYHQGRENCCEYLAQSTVQTAINDHLPRGGLCREVYLLLASCSTVQWQPTRTNRQKGLECSFLLSRIALLALFDLFECGSLAENSNDRKL